VANLGAALQAARKKQGLTLNELAEKSGLSAGFLSKIERSLNSPSFDNLQRICSVLSINASDLMVPLNETANDTLVIRADKRELIYDYSNIFRYESLYRNLHFSLEVATIAGSGAEYKSSQHAYNEICLVACGIMRMVVGEGHYDLEAGDMIYIPAGTRHSMHKVNKKGECIIHCIEIYD